MKRMFLFVALLSVSLSGFLVAQTQTYKDGINSYNEAIMAFAEGDEKGEKKALENAFNIFKSLASQENKEALLLYYLLAEKLKNEFTMTDFLNQFIKTEHPNFKTIESIPFTEADKTFMTENLRKLAEFNRLKAILLLKEAEQDVKQDHYGDALDKLVEAEKLWNIEGIKEKRNNYSQLKKKKKADQLVKQSKGLAEKGLFQDAIAALDSGKESLDTGQISSLKGEFKNSWYQKVINEAKIEFKNKKYKQAMGKCDEAYGIIANDEALKFKRKIEKKMKGLNMKRFAFFADFGIGSTFKIPSQNYSWSERSIYAITLRDYSGMSAEAVKKGEQEVAMGFGLNCGLTYFFTPSLGLSTSIASLFKQEFNITNDYTFVWTWTSTNRGSSTEAVFSDTGSISAIPISVNLLTALKLSQLTRLNLYAGPTLFLAKMDLNTRIGCGTVGISDNYYKQDWYPFEYRINKSDSIFGGNVGADLEFKSKKGAFYIGLQYYFAPAKAFPWELVVKKYDGQFGNFYVSNPTNLSNLPSYQAEVNLSMFKVNLGFKVYF